MPLWSAFVGPAYRTRSEHIDAEALINLYVETVGSSGNAKKSTLLGTPGSQLLLTVDQASCRGMLAQDGRTWVVVGATLYELDLVNTTATSLGIILNDGLPVSFSSNGRGGEQLAIVGGGQLKIFDLLTNTLSAAIVLPLTNAPVMIAFLDGYFLLLEADTVRVWFSALEDGTLWDGLDFFARSESSDNLVGLKVLRDKVWAFGSLTTNVYYDSGDADNPFIPYPGSLMQEGLAAAWAVGIQGEGLIWLSQDNEGHRRVVVANDFSPTRVSTPALDFALAGYSDTSNAELLVYEQEGHSFACFNFPTADATWCFDARESAVRGEPTWHQRDTWDPILAVSSVWRARGVCSTEAGILVGDRFTGGLYTLSLDAFSDACAPIRRLRRAPYVSAENQWLFLDRLELGVQSGVGLQSGQGVDPELMLSLSRDSGHTWTPPITTTVGGQGAYEARAIWRTLGRVRADRLVVEITQTDPVRTVWGPGLWIRARPGSGEL